MKTTTSQRLFHVSSLIMILLCVSVPNLARAMFANDDPINNVDYLGLQTLEGTGYGAGVQEAQANASMVSAQNGLQLFSHYLDILRSEQIRRLLEINAIPEFHAGPLLVPSGSPAGVPITFKNVLAEVGDASAGLLVGLSTIGSSVGEPDDSRSLMVGTGYEILRTQLGNQFDIDVNNPRFRLNSLAFSAGATIVGIGLSLDAAAPVPVPSRASFIGPGAPAEFLDPAGLLARFGSKPGQLPKITVLGSRRGIALFKLDNAADLSPFNILDVNGVAEPFQLAFNKLWQEQAIVRGDEFWLITNPEAHALLMRENGLRSALLDLELPRLGRDSIPQVPMFQTYDIQADAFNAFIRDFSK